MRGINVTGLEDIDIRLVECEKRIEEGLLSIRKQCLQFDECYQGDLSFLIEPVHEEVRYFSTIEKNNNDYIGVLKEVIKSYQSQDAKVGTIVSSILH